MTRRGLSSRKPADYDNEVHGRSDTNAPPGDYTLNTGLVPVNLFRPKYEEGPMIFRPFPMLDYEQPTKMLQPSRKSANPGGYTHWIVRVAGVSYAGSVDKKQVTFLLHHPNDKEGKQNNPYRILYYAAKTAHDNGRFATNQKWDSEWNRLIIGKKGSGPPLDKPGHLYFTQGAMLQNGEKIFMGERRTLPFGLAKGDDLCVQQIKSSAGRALYALLDLERKSYEGDPAEDPGLPFKYGDPTGFFSAKKRKIEAGNFIMVFNPKVTKVQGITGRSVQAGENDDMGKGYDVQLLNEIELNKQLYLPDIDSAGVDQIFDKVCFWFDDAESGDKGLLNIAPAAQQCLWIAQAYSNVPKLLQYAWCENPEFFTDEVNGILRNRAQGAVPGGDDDDDDDRRGRRRGRDDDDDRDDRRSRRDEDDDDRRGRRSRDDDEPRRRSRDDDEDQPRRRSRDEDDDEPRRRSRDDDDDQPRRRPKDDDDDDQPRRRARDDDDDDDRGGSRRDPTQGGDKDDDDDAPPSSRRGRRNDDDEDPPARRRPKDDDDEDQPRRRPKDDDDEDPPARRRPKDDDEDDQPRRRPKDDDDEDPPARRRPKDDDDEDAPRRRPKDDDEDPPARRRPKDDDDEDAPRRRPKDDDRDDDYFDEKKDGKGGKEKDEFADDDRGRGKKDEDLEKSSAAAKTARGNGDKRNDPPPKDAPAPKGGKGGKADKPADKKPSGRGRGGK